MLLRFIISLAVISVIISQSVHAQNSETTRQDLVKNLDDYKELGLTAVGETAFEFMTDLKHQLIGGYRLNNYLFNFSHIDMLAEHTIVNGTQTYRLDSILRIPKGATRRRKTRERCTTMIGTSTEDILFGDATTATKGVCGPIAIVHSLVKLGILTATEAYSGDKISAAPLRKAKRAQKKSKSGMTSVEVAIGHARVKKGTAKSLKCTVSEVPSSNAAKLKKLNQKLKAKLDKTNMDCTLMVTSITKKGVVTLSHVEHILKVSTYDAATGSAIYETQNGFDQGNQKNTVPKDAGKNSWYSIPGGNPPAGLESGANDKIEKGVPAVVTQVGFICCEKVSPAKKKKKKG